jgi:histidinol-phosphate aminotransferase
MAPRCRSIARRWNPQVKLVYLCSPNNPTANLLDVGAIEAVCAALDGKAIVVVDEAYVEWTTARSLTPGSTASDAGDPAHAVQGLCARRRAHRRPARRARIDPDRAARHSALLPGAADDRSALRALEPAELEATRLRLAALLQEREYLADGLAARLWSSESGRATRTSC